MSDEEWSTVDDLEDDEDDTNEDDTDEDDTYEEDTYEEDPDKDTLETEDIKKRIHQALQTIDSNGDFAYFCGLNGILNPNLHINGLNRVVKLPLSSDDTKAIIDHCHRSPFGKGEETLVDTSVRKCWELNTTEFSITTPEWGNYMKRIVADVIKGLGVADKAGSIRADPYKLLLYEKDAFFLSHQDSTKAEGMFATLVICLPTEHEGGEIVLNHQGKRMKFKTSTTSKAGFSYAAWYSDIFHQIKPITNGHRLVLTYNLILEGSSGVPSAPSSKSTPLINALKFWQSRVESDGPDWLLYKLSHMYTDSGLSFNRMKGSDRPRMAELQAACEETGFHLYLGNVERMVDGPCDDYKNADGYYEIEYICQDTTRMKPVIDSQGKTVCSEVPVENSEYIQKSVLRGTPTDEEYSGYTGNEGTSVSHFYRNTAVVIVPESLNVYFRFRGIKGSNQNELSAWLQRLLPLINDPDGSKSREEFIQLAKLVLAHNQAYQKSRELLKSSWHTSSTFTFLFSDAILSTIAQGCYTMRDYKLFDDAIKLHAAFVSPEVYPCIAGSLIGQEYAAVKNILNDTFLKARESPKNQVSVADGLVSACLAIPDDKRPAEWNDLLTWRELKLLDLLPKLRYGGRDELDHIVRIVTLYPTIGRLQETMKLRRQVNSCGITASYLIKLGDSFTTGDLAVEGFPAFYRLALTDLMQDFNLDQGIVEKRASYTGNARTRPEYNSSGIESGDLISLYRQCQSFDISLSTLRIGILKAMRNCESINLAFSEVLLPFIRDMVSGFLSITSFESASAESSFVLGMILEYVLIYVQPRSEAASSWKRQSATQCRCGDCTQLNDFLQSGTRKVLELKMGSSRRFHIHKALNKDKTIGHETHRFGNPFTLVITKLGDPATLWKARAADALKNINSIGSPTRLEEYLGSASYKSLMALDIVVKDHPVDYYIGNPGPDTGGRKRSATLDLNPREAPSSHNVEVIDLT
ncbi:hypothetical protein MGYG_07203 [Nannizzia gypsea CBS 118893]|uniref:Prolyl 4-hydroxylase alpha subunit Fe(2+) 2OG dioxygenase domain-containing protein n=1 Tax=Arthroderma gypseum (strain ATCC MYA-4604 / CBS 118893) TaxID=535722 RepID=E4V2D1_ARTGP|nr:hypothetical protein MGYG_07203 [Nannizzia gypsea CBS 118893]EFR04196.1 hypothetical protein MGYG_07203 [Nannizzia gypsea CBS 118893]